jgi:hypothetical protein
MRLLYQQTGWYLPEAAHPHAEFKKVRLDDEHTFAKIRCPA